MHDDSGKMFADRVYRGGYFKAAKQPKDGTSAGDTAFGRKRKLLLSGERLKQNIKDVNGVSFRTKVECEKWLNIDLALKSDPKSCINPKLPNIRMILKKNPVTPKYDLTPSLWFLRGAGCMLGGAARHFCSVSGFHRGSHPGIQGDLVVIKYISITNIYAQAALLSGGF